MWTPRGRVGAQLNPPIVLPERPYPANSLGCTGPKSRTVPVVLTILLAVPTIELLLTDLKRAPAAR